MDKPSEISLDITPSPFASIIGSNCAPSAAERASLKEFLVAPQFEKAQLEAELSRIQALLKRNEEYLHAHQVLLSPIRNLPSEILAEIFIQCLPADNVYPVRNLKEAPLIFTTICRDWRRVAINTPQLWKSLHFYLPPHLTRDAFCQRAAGVSLWLERSGSLRLSISLHARTTHLSYIQAKELQLKENIESCIRTLLRFSNRIAALSLSLSLAEFALFDKLSPSYFPSLIWLQLRDANLHEGAYHHLSENSERPPFDSLLARMPVLKTLKVHQLHLRSGAASSFISKSLTSLDLSTGGITTFGVLVTPAEGLTLLDHMPLLENIKIAFQLGNDLNDSTFSPPSSVYLARLTELRLIFTKVSRLIDEPSELQTQMMLICDSINCPSLRSLSVSWHGLLITELPFRGLPLPALDTLDLDISMTKEPFHECLSLVSNLTCLRLQTTDRVRGPNHSLIYCSLEESHLLGLTQSNVNVEPLCPRLQKFQLVEKGPSGGLNISPSAIANFIKSRRSTLKDCDFFFNHKPPFTPEQLTSLRKLKEDGLNLRLHCAKPFSPPDIDSPTMGLPDLPYIPQQPTLQQIYGILDIMEGPYGTDIMI